MKATGIIRRIDDLGRVVIPKEIRRNMRIHEGDPLEIFVADGGKSVIFQKYSVLGPLEELCKSLANAFYNSTGNKIIITDYERVIAFGGFSLFPTIYKLEISQQLHNFLNDNNYPTENFDYPIMAQTSANKDWKKVSYVSPVYHEGDLACGIVILDCEMDNTTIMALDFMTSIIRNTLDYQ